jgi:hypothetical protein
MCLRVSKMSEGRCYRDIARPCSFRCGKTTPSGGSGSRSPWWRGLDVPRVGVPLGSGPAVVGPSLAG